jgi:ABC-type amino acid transport substrate-binding protein
LNNKKLGTTKDFTYPEEITKGKKVTEETSDNIANTFSKLEKNRFDLLIMNSFVADFYIKDANLSRKIKKFDFKYSNDGHVFMGFSKKKKLTDAIAAFNKGFAAITKSGKIKELELKYGSK